MAPTTGEMLLEGVDAAPAQTWNRLSLNETTLKVPAFDAQRGASVQDGLPEQAQGIAMGAGADATLWVDAMAGDPTVLVAGDEAVDHEVVIGPRDAPAASEVLLVEEGARAHLTVTLTADEGGQGSFGHNLRIVAGPGSQVEVDMVIAMADGCQALDNVGAILDTDASLEVRQHVLGAGVSCVGLRCDLAGVRARASVDVRYLAGDDQVLDMGYILDQHGRATLGTTSATGVLTGNARKALRTTIDLVRGSKGAQGREGETVLIAGDEVVNKTLPVILCSEDDVQGDHGATIGSLSPEQLAYLGSRGLSPDDACALMGRSLVDDAAGSLPASAAERVVAWAAWNLGEEAAEDASMAYELAHPAREER